MKRDAFATLEAVIRNGTLTAAASERHLTVSAVSSQMKQLEAYFGQPLFDRSGSQLRPMPLAIEAARIMTDALGQIEALREQSHLSVRGIITVGLLESMVPPLLPLILARSKAEFPELEIRHSSGRSVHLETAVKAGELDVALIAQPDSGGSSRLDWQPMEERELVLVVPPMERKLSLAEAFRQYEWIRYDRGTTTGALVNKFILAKGIKTRGSMEFDTSAAILALVNAGLGVSILEISDPKILQIYPVRVIRLGRRPPFYQLSLAVRKADAEKRSTLALKQVLRYALGEVWAQRRAAGLCGAYIRRKG